ncbi:amidohydrolase [Nocardioides sp. ChNu-153]|uniref:amidohydrolase n=1 Tax=unclassified Nocardioides TaxID=2615069 RepID=UPI002404A58B|nr:MULTISPECIES: amidohydrolase [unclassified Nocardioides]MDF9714609.1 amidohydrolase [Nocardioides sp. ChNu-99]MDN7119857.1 amidohydrolase [Nocardioides sp. ChNu-153]
MAHPVAVDVHQHLWSPRLVDRLRARSRAPYLRGWTLHLDGERPFEVDPAAHDVDRRVAADRAAGIGTAVVGLSSPLGVEDLDVPVAGPLLEAHHRDVADLPAHFRGWAATTATDPDLGLLAGLLAAPRFVGLQVPATWVTTPAAWDRLAPVLAVVEAAGAALLVHPGPEPARPGAADLPPWWAPVLGYTAQLQAAWWGWHAAGARRSHPTLRVAFAAAAGLAPLLAERQALRGGGSLLGRGVVDPDVFLDTSGHGPRALEAVVRAVGVDALVLGSDRPYADPLDHLLDPAATHAVRVTNPARLLGAATTTATPGEGARRGRHHDRDPQPDPQPDPRRRAPGGA